MGQLKYGGVPEDESEVIIRLDKLTRFAYINSTWAEWSRKFEKLHGLPKKYQERDGVVYSAFWHLPIKVVSIRRLKSPTDRPKTGRPFPVAPRKTPLPGQRTKEAIPVG